MGPHWADYLFPSGHTWRVRWQCNITSMKEAFTDRGGIHKHQITGNDRWSSWKEEHGRNIEKPGCWYYNAKQGIINIYCEMGQGSNKEHILPQKLDIEHMIEQYYHSIEHTRWPLADHRGSSINNKGPLNWLTFTLNPKRPWESGFIRMVTSPGPSCRALPFGCNKQKDVH